VHGKSMKEKESKLSSIEKQIGKTKTIVSSLTETNQKLAEELKVLFT
jgi:hypothetical protein